MTEAAALPTTLHAVEPIGGRVLPLFAIAAKPVEVHSTLPVPPATTPDAVPIVSTLELAVAKATVIELPVQGPSSTADDAVAVVERIELEAPAAAQADDESVAEAERVELETPDAALADDEALVTIEEADQPARDATPVDLQAAAAMPAVEVDSPVPPEAPAADDWARWEALAEEIRMQVLQRIDIFTDTGLREQLSAQMQPIVERASAELVATINEQVGKLLRAYIAEAIEREIEKWRTGNS